MNYDWKTRKDYLDIFYKLGESANDYDLLKIGTEIIRLSAARLDNDLDNKKINEEYIKLKLIIESLENIINNYV